ncbi:MAG: transcription factor S [Candidatus Woesearchaeota archaeon]
MIKFCPKCGSILLPKKDNNTIFFKCACGYSENTNKDTLNVKEKIKEKKEISTIEKEIEIHPIIKEECPKCGNNEAFFWEVQTRASDEPATKFLKCTKCKHIWRDYK